MEYAKLWIITSQKEASFDRCSITNLMRVYRKLH